ncbi:hypothetical protein OHC33_006764 [Knufia fluminis]|uniref:Alpha-L-rhamnosidase n=1 Tax=Knufia fluminis TaxID=191047 RepID=A0AAN8ERI9_9EURO|nr:hypothetical protein OHC33_006764 [Knufia fluminis]
MWKLVALIAYLSFAQAVPKKFTPTKLLNSPDPSDTESLVSLPLQLNSPGQGVILDYGHEVAGTPYLMVTAIDQPVQLEVRYSEELSGLDSPFGDGPFPFSVGLSSTFRTETFNVTSPGTIHSYFIQGGQRWQSITQLTEGTLTIAGAGFEASIQYQNPEDLPGHFECSNSAYNEIWKLGALASTAACVEAGSQRATWEITPDGALIHGQKPALSALGNTFSEYTLSFSTKILRGGAGWAQAQTPSLTGLQLLLTSELEEDTTFVNTNTTITPPSSIALAYGYSFVNQSTLPSFYLDNFEIPFAIKEDTWYNIDATLLSDSTLTVAIDGTEALNVSLSDYGVSLGNQYDPTALPGTGSWGFGPWVDQVALYANISVAAQNGTELYRNSLTDEAVLAEYGVARNNATVCLDGPKRDRLVWLGDFFHTTRIIPASTARRDHVLGTLQLLLDWQNEEGLLPIDPPMGTDPLYAPQVGGYLGLADYQTLGLLAFTGYFELTGDIDFAQQLWPGFQKQTSWLISQINTTTGLAEISGFTGPASGTATSAMLVQALNEAATVATALNDTASAKNYTTTASNLADAIDTSLWNEDLGIYSTSLSAPSNFSVADISFAITSGIASHNTTRLTSLLAALEQLSLGPGYKDTSATSTTDPTVNISPNINGFLLSALMRANATMPAKFLLDTLWTAMIDDDATSTGASWEYVNAATRGPGLGLFTSLSHPWGGAPTYILPQWVAGVRSVRAGYEEWVIVPGLGFNVTSASARVPTRFGELSVSWEAVGEILSVNVTAPEGTKGRVELPGVAGRELGMWNVNGKDGKGGEKIELGAGKSSVTFDMRDS